MRLTITVPCFLQWPCSSTFIVSIFLSPQTSLLSFIICLPFLAFSKSAESFSHPFEASTSQLTAYWSAAFSPSVFGFPASPVWFPCFLGFLPTPVSSSEPPNLLFPVLQTVYEASLFQILNFFHISDSANNISSDTFFPLSVRMLEHIPWHHSNSANSLRFLAFRQEAYGSQMLAYCVIQLSCNTLGKCQKRLVCVSRIADRFFPATFCTCGQIDWLTEANSISTLWWNALSSKGK